MLNTVPYTKIADNLHFSVRTDGTLIWDWLLTGFRGHRRSSRMLKISFSLSTSQTSDSQLLSIVLLLAFLDLDVSVQIGGGKWSIVEEPVCPPFLQVIIPFQKLWCNLTRGIYFFGCTVHYRINTSLSLKNSFFFPHPICITPVCITALPNLHYFFFFLCLWLLVTQLSLS